MCRLIYVAAAALLAFAGFGVAPTARAQKLPRVDDAVRDQKAMQLLRRMVEAERRVPYIARESTIRADGPGAEHVVKFDPKRGVRREPADGKGRVFLDDKKQVYRFRLGKPGDIETDESRFGKLSKRLKELATRLGKRDLSAQIVGQDTIAGRTCDIVEVRASRVPDAPTRRFWIDRDTGLRMRTEEKSAQGKVLSGSYYTSLDLKPVFSRNDFVPPKAAERAEGGRGNRDWLGKPRRRFSTSAEARQAGFSVSEPSYLPPGYVLRQVEATESGSHIALRYANGLNALSLTLLRDGIPPRVTPLLRPDGSAYVPFPQGKHGLFVRGASGAAYLLIGDLPESEMRKVAASMK